MTTSTDAQLVEASDAEQFAFVLSDRRVLVTHDHDFLRPEFAGQDHPGIVYCPPDTKRIGEVVRFLSLMFEVLAAQDMRNVIEYF